MSPLTIWASLSPTKAEHRAAGAVRLHRGREPDLAGAALHLVLFMAVALVERRKLAAELDHVAIAVVPFVQHGEVVDDGVDRQGSRGARRSVCRSCPLYRRRSAPSDTGQCGRNCSKRLGGLSWPLVAARSLRLRTAPGRREIGRPQRVLRGSWRPAAAPIRWCRATLYGPRRTARSGIHRASWRRPAPAGRGSRRPASRSRRRRAAAHRNAPCRRPRSWLPRSPRRR